MAFNRKRLMAEVGRRLVQIREKLNYSLDDMARKTNLSSSGYYKNEAGMAFPNLYALNTLQRDMDISMDWLIFNKGPMFFQEKQPEPEPEPEPVEEENTLSLENASPDVRELFEYLESDRLFKHKVLVYFYKYKESKERNGLTETLPEESVDTENGGE